MLAKITDIGRESIGFCAIKRKRFFAYRFCKSFPIDGFKVGDVVDVEAYENRYIYKLELAPNQKKEL